MRVTRRTIDVPLVALLLLGLGGPAWAALGDTVESVAADRDRMQGELRSFAGAGYEAHEIRALDGAVVREFVSPGGRVFAVAWQGTTPPAFAPLLGSFFREFQQAPKPTTRQHHPVVIRTARLVVETGGHMRAFRGRAYVPELWPAGVSKEVVR